MAAWSVTFDGIDKTTSVRTVGTVIGVSRPLNERGIMRFDLLPGFYPDRFAEVILYDGATKLFAGVLRRRKTKGVADRETPRVTACEVADYSIYADWRYVTKTYTDPVTVKQVLTDLVADYLVDYGVTLDPAQLTGATIAAFAWTRKKLKTCLRELSERTGWIFRFDADKKLKMFAPGTDASSINISDATPNCQDLFVDDSEKEPITFLTGVFGADGGDDTLTQTWVSDGVTTTYTLEGLNVPASLSYFPNVVFLDGVQYPTGFGDGHEAVNGIWWDGSANDGSLIFKGDSVDLIPIGTVIFITYGPQYPFELSISLGPSPSDAREELFDRPDILHYGAAQEVLAQKALAVNQEPRLLKWFSREHGWATGESASVQHSARGLVTPTDVSITNVELSLSSKFEWLYTVDAQETTDIQFDVLTLPAYRNLLGGPSGSSSGGGSVGALIPTSRGWSHGLGGSESIAVAMDTPAMTPIWSSRPFYATEPFAALVRSWQWASAAGVAVTTQVRRLSDDAIVVTSDDVTASARPTDPEALAFATEADEAYVLDVTGDTSGVDVFALADLYRL